MELSTLSPAHGSRKKARRLGRGESSGAGKTSGRGGKGQTARTGGKVRAGFEGGQMPLYRRLPKWGFISRRRVFGTNLYVAVNLSALERFSDGDTVDPQSLNAAGITGSRSRRAGIKILGHGQLTRKLTVKAHAFSAQARAKIEAAGGTAEVIQTASAVTA